LTIASFKKGGKLTRWERNFENPRDALKQIGVLMVAESQGAFKQQKHGSKKWKGRAPVNVYGILADFAAGKNKPPKRRFDTRPALRDTGRLSASIAFKVYGRTSVAVGTNLPYAAVLNFGGKIESVPITAGLQTALGKWLKKQSDKLRDRLGFLMNPDFEGETLKGEVEPRRFIGITKQTIEDVREVVRVEIMEV
jgi:phage gpG-like protein